MFFTRLYNQHFCETVFHPCKTTVEFFCCKWCWYLLNQIVHKLSIYSLMYLQILHVLFSRMLKGGRLFEFRKEEKNTYVYPLLAFNSTLNDPFPAWQQKLCTNHGYIDMCLSFFSRVPTYLYVVDWEKSSLSDMLRRINRNPVFSQQTQEQHASHSAFSLRVNTTMETSRMRRNTQYYVKPCIITITPLRGTKNTSQLEKWKGKLVEFKMKR